MPFDDDPDDERPVPDRFLPQDDRLWRHPSELGAGHLPRITDDDGSGSGRRSPALVTLGAACLAGAVVAIGAMWLARPTRVVHEQTRAATAPTVTRLVASFTANTVPTERLADQMAPSLALLRVRRDGAWINETAIWIDARGTLVASAPSVWGATELWVVGTDGRARRGTLVGVDTATGLAAVIADKTAGTPIAKTARPTRVGQAAAVVGAAGSDAGKDTGSATVAGVIVRSTSIRASVDGVVLHDAIQLDRQMPDDALGGGLVDAQGTVLGLVVGNSTERSLAAVTPGTTLISTGTALRDHGSVRRAWMGVRTVDLDPAVATLLDLRGGALITAVADDSPAAAAGLKPDDIVTKVDRTTIDDATDLVLALRHHQPGDRIVVTLHRGPDREVEKVTLAG